MTLDTALAKLETSGLIALAQVEPELEYLFRHALIQDAVYASILKSDRRILHRAIGETLEQLYPERLASRELAPTLGHHFAAAGERESASQYFAFNEPGDLDRARALLREAQSDFEAMNVPKYSALVRERLAQIG